MARVRRGCPGSAGRRDRSVVDRCPAPLCSAPAALLPIELSGDVVFSVADGHFALGQSSWRSWIPLHILGGPTVPVHPVPETRSGSIIAGRLGSLRGFAGRRRAASAARARASRVLDVGANARVDRAGVEMDRARSPRRSSRPCRSNATRSMVAGTTSSDREARSADQATSTARRRASCARSCSRGRPPSWSCWRARTAIYRSSCSHRGPFTSTGGPRDDHHACFAAASSFSALPGAGTIMRSIQARPRAETRNAR
jgi:hypothetical protein